MTVSKARTCLKLTALTLRRVASFTDPKQPFQANNKQHLALRTEITEFLECHDTAYHSTLFIGRLASFLFTVSACTLQCVQKFIRTYLSKQAFETLKKSGLKIKKSGWGSCTANSGFVELCN